MIDREQAVVGSGGCPIVLGECVQGQLLDGQDFHITTPLKLASEATYEVLENLDDVVVDPGHCVKASRAVRQFLEEEGLPVGARLQVETPVRCSIGFGTSTADIVASLRAAADAWERPLDPERISRIAISIEPTDGSMYPGSVAFDHRRGRLLEVMGSLPSFEAVTLIEGNDVDTVAFDEYRRSFRYSAEEDTALRGAWEMVREAIRSQDVKLMGAAGVTSARINQRFLSKPLFNELLEAYERLGAVGLLIAHSGSAIALVLDPSDPRYDATHEGVLSFLETLGISETLVLRNF